MGMNYPAMVAALLALGLQPVQSGNGVPLGESEGGDAGDDFPEPPEPDLEALRKQYDTDEASRHFKCVYGNYPIEIPYWKVYLEFPDGIEVAEVFNGYVLIRDPENRTRFLMTDAKPTLGSISCRCVDQSTRQRVETRYSRIRREQRQKQLSASLSRYFYGESLPNKVRMTIYYPNIF